MKKMILILVAVFSVNTIMAQACSKTCDKANKYVLNNDLIEATLYHDNGEIAQTGFYTEDNKLQGEWISYDAQGNKTAIGSYDNGKKVGTWLFFDGNTKKEVTFKDARMAEVKTWNLEGTRVVTN